MRLSKPAWLLHAALAVIVAGGVITWLTGDRGQVVLGPGESVTAYRSVDGMEREFPFSLSLDSFRVDYYPGGEVPRDFVSVIRIDGKERVVSVNNIVSERGYRLCQMSYDGAGRTVLGVNRDPVGIAVTYTGYALFAVAGLGLLLSRWSGFRRGLRRLAAVGVIVAASGLGIEAAETIAGVPRQQADSLARKQVVYNGKVMTFNSLARDFTAKITGAPSYRGLSAEQFIASWLLYPEQWRSERAIRVKDSRLRDRLGVDGDRVSLDDLFSETGDYRLGAIYGKGDRKLDRAIEEVDEKVGLVMALLSGKLIASLGDDIVPLSPARVESELIYNRLPLSTAVFMLLFLGAVVAFASLWWRKAGRVAVVLLWSALAVQVVAYALEWYLASHIPLAGTGETMQFLLLILLPLLLLFRRSSPLLLPVGMLIAGALALVAHLIGSDPVMTSLMPVLSSPWLSIHVTLVMAAYSLFAFTVTCSLIAFFSPCRTVALMRLDRVLLYPALYLLGLGIITGAVWANVSWGRYWAWDPKETWALITFLVYAVAVHRSVKPLRSPRAFHAYMIFAFLAVLITYFGVNAMTSLHSYSG